MTGAGVMVTTSIGDDVKPTDFFCSLRLTHKSQNYTVKCIVAFTDMSNVFLA